MTTNPNLSEIQECPKCGADVDPMADATIVEYHNDIDFDADYFCGDECHMLHHHGND